jgi:hypothetical protein
LKRTVNDLQEDTNPELTGCYLTILKNRGQNSMHGVILDVLFLEKGRRMKSTHWPVLQQMSSQQVVIKLCLYGL